MDDHGLPPCFDIPDHTCHQKAHSRRTVAAPSDDTRDDYSTFARELNIALTPSATVLLPGSLLVRIVVHIIQ